MDGSSQTLAVEYRDVDGFPGYRVGSDGTVWTCRIPGRGNRFGKWRKMFLGNGIHGYLIVGLTAGKKRKTKYVHALVLSAFVGPRPPGMQACHDPDPNPANVALSNLRWDTPAGNCADRIKHGTHPGGERNGRAKLSKEQVIEIREKHASGHVPTSLAKQFGVSAVLIKKIVSRECWKRV